MTSGIRQFVIESLTAMNYDVEDIDDDTTLGPAGADLESLAIAELAVRVEDRYSIKFSEDEAEELSAMTVGEFCATVAQRITSSAGTPAGATSAVDSTDPASDITVAQLASTPGE